MVEGMQTDHALPRRGTCLSMSLSLGIFMAVSLHRCDGVNHWSLVIKSAFSPSSLSQAGGGGTGV